MKVRSAVLAQKRIVASGGWKLITGNSRMPRNAFFLGSNYPVVLARHWHWRVDRLAANATPFRLLTAFNDRTEEFLAWLAVDFEKNAILLARYEYHGSHPGWHCHAPCEDIGRGDLGALMPRCKRMPDSRGFHRDEKFDTTSESRALARSFTFFRVQSAEGGLI